MPTPICSSGFVMIALVGAFAALPVRALESQTGSSPPKEQRSQSIATRTALYEDDQVKIVIPAGWTFSKGDHPAVGPYDAAGSSITQAKAKLLLESSGYTLALAYDTDHTSGPDVGEFIEIFRIPWLDADQASECAGHLTEYAQPTNRTLMFMNETFRTDDPQLRENCGIASDLGQWITERGTRSFVGEQRWFAGYFTTANRGWFFESDGDDCGEKAYTLTSRAKTPAELPAVDDPNLQRIIDEAIKIVDSIAYKRCPPGITH